MRRSILAFVHTTTNRTMKFWLEVIVIAESAYIVDGFTDWLIGLNRINRFI